MNNSLAFLLSVSLYLFLITMEGVRFLPCKPTFFSFFFLDPFNFLIIMESKWLKQNKMGQWWEVNLEGQAEGQTPKGTYALSFVRRHLKNLNKWWYSLILSEWVKKSKFSWFGDCIFIHTWFVFKEISWMQEVAGELWDPKDLQWPLPMLVPETKSMGVLTFMSQPVTSLFQMRFVSCMIFNMCIASTERETNRKQT